MLRLLPSAIGIRGHVAMRPLPATAPHAAAGKPAEILPGGEMGSVHLPDFPVEITLQVGESEILCGAQDINPDGAHGIFYR